MQIKSLPELFHKVASENAERLAVVDGEFSLTYAELLSAVVARADEYTALGVRQGDSVGVMLPNSAQFVVSYFAATWLGAIVVPLNDGYQENEICYFVESCGLSLIVSNKSHAEMLGSALSAMIRESLASETEAGEIDNLPSIVFVEEFSLKADTIFSNAEIQSSLSRFPAEIAADSPLMFQFSSGSTGTPKRIARSHRKVLFELESLQETLSVTNQDRFIGVAPFTHVNGLMRSMINSITAGATLYPVPQFNRQAVLELIAREKITMFIAVPFMFSILSKGRFRVEPDFSSIRYCISASAPMPRELNKQFREKFGHYVRQLYGSTETGTISVDLSEDIEHSLESVGLPIRGVKIDVFLEDGTPAAIGEMGEVCVNSPAAIEGYDHLPEVNKEAFKNGYFLTGDLGHKDAQGRCYLIGRKKFFINKGGYKINPHEIEELIAGNPLVEEVAVVGVPTAFGDEKVKAVIVAKQPISEEEIVASCRGKIADFKLPSLVEFRTELPKSPTGKLRRKMLI